MFQLILWPVLLVVLGLPAIANEPSSTIPPAFVPDTELAKYPIIVIGKWEKAKFENKSVVEGNVMKKYFVTTKFVIEKVIAGEAEVGKQTVSIGLRIGWEADMDYQVWSYMSTEMPGDANANESNLWFLKRKQFDDGGGIKDYLHLDSYRGIQPKVLEGYFGALRRKNPAAEMAKMIESPSAEVVRRCLHYISGDDFYGANFDAGRPSVRNESKNLPNRVRKPLIELAENVDSLIEDKRKGVGWLAAWTYSDLKGNQAMARMRELLTSEDTTTVCVALSSMIKHADWEMLDNMVKAASRVRGHDGISIIRQLESIPDDQALPILMGMLQTAGSDTNYYSRIPAVESRNQLAKRTGIHFPFDVKLAQKLWGTVTSLDSKTAKNLRIEELSKKHGPALKAELVGDKNSPKVRIQNVGEFEVEVPRQPQLTSIVFPSCHSSFGGGNEDNTTIVLRPGESFEFDLELEDRFFVWPNDSRSIEVDFSVAGRPLTRTSWAGSLVVKQTGTDWQEPEKKIEKIERRWANGNLKTTGQKTNGIRTGEWKYFNEDGDLVRSEDNGTTTVHNSDHPNNKGAGKKR